ncbi:MAG: hypothetical protein ABIP54_04695, partial [Candidatus Andersenbacteria bacterium]
MKPLGIAIGGGISVMLLVLGLVSSTQATSAFVVKGIVDVIAPTKNALYVTGTYASNQDTTDNSLNKNIAFKISSKAKIQTYV